MSTNTASPSSTIVPSVDRAPLAEEACIADLQKSVVSLKKKIADEERKLQRYRDEFFTIQNEMQSKGARGIARGNQIVLELAHQVIETCTSEKASAQVKRDIRDVLFTAVAVFGAPDIEMPEWLPLDPPEPKSLELLQAKNGGADNKFSKQSSFDFFDDEANHKTGADGDSDSSDDYEDPFASFFEELEQQSAEEAEEARRILRGGAVNVDDNEKRALRGLYLRLVSAVHPDLATDEDDRVERTQLAARINNAYKAGQFTVLLEIEEQLNKKKKSDAELSRYQFFIDEIKHLQETQRLLLEQLSRVKADFKKLKKSEIGETHKELKKYVKNGSINEEVLFNEVQEKGVPFVSLTKKLQRVNAGQDSLKMFKRWFKVHFYDSEDEYAEPPFLGDEDFEGMMEDLFTMSELSRKSNKKGARRR
jgi:hypothetical protein